MPNYANFRASAGEHVTFDLIRKPVPSNWAEEKAHQGPQTSNYQAIIRPLEKVLLHVSRRPTRVHSLICNSRSLYIYWQLLLISPMKTFASASSRPSKFFSLPQIWSCRRRMRKSSIASIGSENFISLFFCCLFFHSPLNLW